jgi:hypothetical protein
MADLQIRFDGSTLSLSDGSDLIYSVDAVSGKDGYQNPIWQPKENYGPIPEGTYSFSVDAIQTPT